MTDTEIELVFRLSIDIGDLYKSILRIFPADNEKLLKHLAGSSIHLALFIRDFHESVDGNISPMNNQLMNKFLSECGCDFNKDKEE